MVYLRSRLGAYLLLVLVILGTRVFAQIGNLGESPFNVELFRTRDGLPHNTITTLYQDRKGFLWIGTYNGLCRYDGYEFKLYQDELNPNGVKVPHTIEAIFEDDSMNIWVGTRGGAVSCFNSRNETWRSFHRKEHPITAIRCFFEAKDGTIWVGSRDGYLGSIDRNREVLQFRKPLNSGVSGIRSYGPTNLLIIGDSALIYAPDQGKILKYTATGVKYPTGEQVVNHTSGLVVMDARRLVISAGPGEKAKLIPLETGLVSRSKLGIASHKDRFILYMPNKLLIFQKDGSCIDSISFPDYAEYLEKQVVNFALLDRDNILWLATNSGLVKIDKDKLRFESITNKRTSTENYVRSVFSSEEGLWVGYRKAEVRFIRSKYGEEQSSLPIVFFDVFGSKNKRPTVNCFLKTRDGAFYAGCLEGLAIFNSTKTEMRTLRPGKEAYNNMLFQEIWALYEDSWGNIWIGTNKNGLFIWSPTKDSLTYIKDFPDASGKKAPIFSVWSILEDSQGRIWLGTSNGLYTFKGNDTYNQKDFVQSAEFGKQKLSGLHVWNLMEDSKQRLWVGTTDGGVNVVNKERTGFYSLSVNEGMPTDAISSIVEDGDGNIWLGTMNGLMRIEANSSMEVFTEDHGLLSNDFNFKAAERDKEGNLYFGTKLGIVFFQPERFREAKPTTYAPVITGFAVLGKERMDSVLNKQEIELDYWQNFFQFRFSILHFRNTSKHIFRYRLKGFEDQWNVATFKNPFARYTQVAPGEYVLEVEASIDGVNWHRQSLQKKIRIYPAFWQRTWFIATLIILVALLVGGIIRWRFLSLLGREKERAVFMRRLGELELQALQAQMNPHFIFNSINSIQHYVLNHDEIAANNYLTNFARLMRLFLQSSKQKYITLKDELEILGNYIKMESLRFEEKFDYSIDVEEAVPMHVKIPTMLLQPFVENSINHGLLTKNSKGRLHISIIREGDMLCCKIDDDGIGREKAALIRKGIGEHRSMGMGLVEERLKIYEALEEMNVSVNITDKVTDKMEALGTLVEICIPIKNWNDEGSHY